MNTVVCRPIGIVHSRFTEASGMPIQTAGAPDEAGRVEVFTDRVGWFGPRLAQLSSVRSDDGMG
jgi:tRNA (Thr-GGU) A37 N-methylase